MINNISVWCSHHEKVTEKVRPLHLMNEELAADLWNMPTDFGLYATSIYSHHLHFISVSEKANTYFYVPHRAESRVDLRTALTVCSMYPRLHIVAASTINTQDDVQSWDLMDCSHIHTYIYYV